MNKLFGLVAIVVLSLTTLAQDKSSVTVVVEFNGANYNINKEISASENLTALNALMMVSEVETHPVNEYVFVNAINDVKNIKGLNAWYFTVNDVPSKVLAISCNLQAGDVVKWIYKTDVCSKTVDGCTSATKKAD